MRVERSHRRGMALLLTLVTIMLLSLEVAIVSTVATRGMGQEATLFTRHTAVRRGAETAINRLNTKIANYLNGQGTPNQAESWFAEGGSGAITNQSLTLDNPDGGSTTSPVIISAYLAERKGSFYHLVGRARENGIDIKLHRWVQLKHCPEALQLILSDRRMNNPYRVLQYVDPYPFVMADASGRVFFGEDSSPGKFWTWHPDTGLSTIVTNESKPGYNTMAVTQDGRVFFGEDAAPGSFWTWKADTGLSTLVASTNYSVAPAHDYNSFVYLAPDGRVTWSESHYWGNGGRGTIWTWKEGVGLSTVLATSATVGSWGVYGIGPGGHIYFAKITTSPSWLAEVYYWLEGTTVKIANHHAYIDDLKIAPNGRIAFQAGNDPGRIWTWMPGSPLTINNFDSYTHVIHIPGISPFEDRIFYAGKNWDTTADQCRMRKPDGTLTTIASGSGIDQLCGGPDSAHDINDAFFLGTAANYQAFLPGFVWNSSSGTTTRYLASDYFSEWGVSDDGRVFGKPKTSDAVVTWKNGVLSTLVSGIAGVGDKALVVRPDGRVFFGTNAANGSLWTWKEGVGLSTLVTNAAYPGYLSLRVAGDGRVFFGEKGNGVRLWTWKEQSCSP
ncbi:MAG TPA: WD40 repeat domain-containing protein [Oculatellaceae cyanobacterium]